MSGGTVGVFPLKFPPKQRIISALIYRRGKNKAKRSDNVKV